MGLFSCPIFAHLPSFVLSSHFALSFLWSLVILCVSFLFHVLFLVWVRYPPLVLVLLDLPRYIRFDFNLGLGWQV